MDLGKKLATNEKGFDFYLDNMCNNYAITSLGKNYKVLIVAKDDKPLERVLTKDSKPIYNHTSMESMIFHIDVLKIKESYETK